MLLGDVIFDKSITSCIYFIYMNTAVINIKTEPKTKAEAQKVAAELGIRLSVVINGLLKRFIREKTVTFDRPDEIPNKRTAAILKKARENRERGLGSPIFDNAKDAIAYLEKQGI